MRGKENTRTAARSTVPNPLIPCDYWIGGFGSRLIPGSITKV